MRNLCLLFAFLFFNQVKAQNPCYSLPEFLSLISTENQAISVDLENGWNNIGYVCVEPMDAVEAFAPVLDILVIVKNNVGMSYLPEWGFNGIGDLQPGQGYQLKTTSTYSNFQFCESYIVLAEVSGCTDCTATNFDIQATVDDGSCTMVQELEGCGDPTALNYDSNVTIDNNTCVYPEQATSQYFLINEGWQYWSTYLDLGENSQVVNVFSEIAGNLHIVKNSDGLFYWPAFSFDGIGALEIGQAYQIYVDQEVSFDLEGEQYHTIEALDNGVNWLAYNKTYSTTIEGSFTDLTSLVYVSDGFGNVYYPEYGINEIGLLHPGKGYKVVTNNAAAEFSYSPVSAYSCLTCGGCMSANAENFNPFATEEDGSCLEAPYVSEYVSSTNVDVIFLNEAFEDAGLTLNGWLVAYYTNDAGEEAAVSSAQWLGAPLSLSLWADDSITSDVQDGFYDSDEVVLKYITDDNTYLITELSQPNSESISSIEIDFSSHLVIDGLTVE